ncbi:unnamed protein product [Paramecium sonneborni]|uniref:Era-type G domain-containing protein n=1 Tax=Paramecium sonneborni TaxID=65129 RepID=A0A8S1R6V4_9CILI|nr:unnamed protein product [Paramecium sonneborni]
MIKICGYCMSNLQKLKKYAPPKKLDEKTIRPYQHPTNPLSKKIDILTPTKPERFLLEDYETPTTLYTTDEKVIKTNELGTKVSNKILLKPLADKPSVSIEEQKYLAVSIIGPPNSGKSTFLNQMVGEPISAVSNKSNTTVSEIRGVHTDIKSGVQIEFVDTPGVTKRYKFSKYFVTKAWNAIEDTNLVIILIDAIKTLDISMNNVMQRLNQIKVDQEQLRSYFRNEDNFKQSEEKPIPKILVFNKMDLCFNKKKLKWLQTEMEDLGKYDQIFYISSLTGYGIEDLKQYLYSQSFQCKWKHNENQKHLFTPMDQLEQIIRQAIFKRFYKEIPFIIGIYVKEFRVTSKESAKIEIQINVQTSSQARIVIGEEGRALKQVKNDIEISMAEIYKRLFQIKLQVTIKEGEKQIEFDTEKEDRIEHAQFDESFFRKQERDRKQLLNVKFSKFLQN